MYIVCFDAVIRILEKTFAKKKELFRIAGLYELTQIKEVIV